MQLANVTDISCSKGNVVKITRASDGAVLWSKGNRYEIRVNGETVKKVTIKDFVKMVQDGVAKSKYGIGAQIVVPYTDPVDGKEYECPFNFGTFRNFTLQSGKAFSGLGLQTEYRLPRGSLNFDAKEPENPVGNRAMNGNNRWKLSNIRQWMNARGIQWFTPTHDYDALGTMRNEGPLNSWPGLLDCFPTDFIDALAPVSVKTQTSRVDGGGIDITYDTFFLLSTWESYVAGPEETTILNKNTEGDAWEYWIQKTGLSSPQEYNAVYSPRAQKLIGGVGESGIWSMLRSAQIESSGGVPSGIGIWVVVHNAGNKISITTANNNSSCISPACAIGADV